MGLIQDKRDYLKKHFGIQLKSKEEKTHIVNCEFCQRKLEVYTKGIGIIKILKAQFHHDSEGLLHLYCITCHKRIHDWGQIQRWLIKSNKTVDDIPDSIGTKSMRKDRYNFW